MEITWGRLDDALITPLDREDIMQVITDLWLGVLKHERKSLLLPNTRSTEIDSVRAPKTRAVVSNGSYFAKGQEGL